MKRKKLSWSQLIKEIKEAKKDPEFLKALDEFIRFHTGKSPR
jgi:hypothetical protein